MADTMDARKLALSALSEVTRKQAFATLALNRFLSGSKLKPEDKRLATGIFYTALENRLRLAHVLGQFVKRMPSNEVEDVLHIAAAQLLLMDRIPDHAAVDEAVKQIKAMHQDGFVSLVNGALRNLIRSRDAGTIEYPDKEECPERYLSIMYSLPEPIVRLIVSEYGLGEAERIIAYRESEHHETVRPNFSRMDNVQFMKYAEGREWSPVSGVVPGAVNISGAIDPSSDKDFKRGMYSMISEPSMLAAYAVQPKRGQMILDACAAPGGKTCLIAELMGGSGRVSAWDVHEHRVELIKAAKQRLGLDNIKPMVRDASVYKPDLDYSFDAVLIDAPCSGLGVMLNKPDIKYRVKVEDIEELRKIQMKILDACCNYVAVGGMLVYSTCTITASENRGQVERFLSDHPNYELDTSDAYLPDALKGAMEGGMLQLLPYRDHMEGFFIARLRRKS